MAVIFLFLGLNVQAAVLHGTVYEWYTFQPLDNAVIEVNSVPNQTIVSKNGEYSFELSEGNYAIHAEYFENNQLLYAADENVSIQEDGNFVLDLIMFPSTDFVEGDLPPLDEGFDENDLLVQQQQKGLGLLLPIIAIILIILIAVFVFFKTKNKAYLPMVVPKEELVEVKEEKIQPMPLPIQSNNSLNKDAQSVVEMLKRYGGRMNQKELREKTNLGEAKLSLIVAELESMQLVKKIKHGRGNIIVLIEK